MSLRHAISVLAAVTLVSGCSSKAADREPQPHPAPYVIGLGEIMGLNQMRHAKLWFAGDAGNWPLAAYEIDELREGFADAALYHSHHKSVPRPLAEMIPEYTETPLAELGAAVRSEDKASFTVAFDALTDGCNACHKEAGFDFNVVTRPTTPPFSNQSYAPPATAQ